MTGPEGGGFWDFVKKPALWRKAVRKMRQDEAAPPATDPEVVRLVAAMKERPLTHEELTRLRKAGDAVVRPILAAARDAAFISKQYGESILEGSPRQTALDLVEPFAPAGLVEALEPALRHESARVRQYATYTLGRCGADEAIGALNAGLADPDGDVREYTLMGIQFIHRTGRGSPTFRQKLFDATTPLLEDAESGVAGHAPRTLLALDRDRAAALLTKPGVFRADNERISDVLNALLEFDVAVPGDKLRALLEALKPKTAEYPFDWAYGRPLILLARAEGRKSTDLIRDALSWGGERVCKFAADAIGIASGAEDAYGFVWELFEHKGVAELTEPQRHYLTLRYLDAEVRNGGFAQYFFSSSGDLAAFAVEAAQAVGAPEAAGIIGEAIGLFGNEGPEPDRDERHDQLARIEDDELERLTSAYYKCGDDLQVLLPLYVAQHVDHFRRKPA